MMLAAELALGEVDVVIFEQRLNQDIVGLRAGGLHARSLEILDQRGIVDRFLSEGQVAQVVRFANTVLDISDFPTRHPYGLALWQNHIERILAEWVRELGVPTHYGREVTGFVQDEAGVDVQLSDGRPLRSQYLIGCDGGRSVIRKAAGIAFPGWDATTSNIIAEVEMTGEPDQGIRHDATGIHAISTMENGHTMRVMVTEREIGRTGDPTLRQLSDELIAVYDTDFGVHSPTSISRFTDMTRQAERYRDRRVLLAGDSAHIHYPAGGQGLGMGMQDAVNLGWKLAQVINRTVPDLLLDTYQAERHPVTARALQLTMAQTALLRPEPRKQALIDTIVEMLVMDEPRKHVAGLLSGLDLRYDLGDGHPLLGRRMPDLDLMTASGPLRVYALLHRSRPAFINFGRPEVFDLSAWGDSVQRIDARTTDCWELPVLGVVAAPDAVLIRPDGYVAWVGEGTDDGLSAALTKWLGPPAQ
jgi:3-(3-hydroxy-phenyl)propionate hydroxylase